MAPMISHQDLLAMLTYDRATGVFVWAQSPKHTRLAGEVAGVTRKDGYRQIEIEGKHYRAHRLAWFYCNAEWPNIIDHINGDKADNRIANLRSVDKVVNGQNKRSALRNNKTGVLGVCMESGKFRANIRAHGKTRTIGRFSTLEEARQAYLAAKRELHAGNTL